MNNLIKNNLAYLYLLGYKYGLFKKININSKKNIRIFENGHYSNNNDYLIPKIVWMFWDGVIPYEIECFHKKIKIDNPNWDIKILNFKNIKQYIQDDIKWHELDMPIANITDYIRIRLIYEYGGIWLDSSIILNTTLDNILNLNDNKTYDYIGFYRDISTLNINYPVIESWFFASYKKNNFIKKILDIYTPVLQLGSKKYYKKLQERSDFLEISQKISPPEYLIYYFAIQIALKEFVSPKLFLYCADDSAYLVQDTIGWRSYKTTAYFFLNNAPQDRPLLYKLTHGDRQFFKYATRKSIMNKYSIMGEIL